MWSPVSPRGVNLSLRRNPTSLSSLLTPALLVGLSTKTVRALKPACSALPAELSQQFLVRPIALCREGHPRRS